jgi:DNA-binding winged helix-turn-helix (wHTH) protein
VPCYRFGDFVLSPRRRALLRAGEEQPLIPRYFDLLVYLVERRGDAVHRREIFDRVWSDVIVSDSALSQAVRTIRRTLGDDSREPRFVRTVSRHGYQFVGVAVVEDDDTLDVAPAAGGAPHEVAAAAPIELAAPAPVPAATDHFAPLLDRVTADAGAPSDEDQRDAAEALHALGTAEALRRLGTRAGHARARALLRDTRWDVAGAGAVPVRHAPSAVAVAWHVVVLRLRRAAGLAATRAAAAAAGGGAAGAAGGLAGGLLLALGPGGTAPLTVVPVLMGLGAVSGAAGGAGVGAGLAAAETVLRARRTAALVAGGALGGGVVGLAVQWMVRWTLAALVGFDVAIGGGLDGLALGGAAALGYAAATGGSTWGVATPRGPRRWRTLGLTALACGLAALALAAAGRPLVGGTIHALSTAFAGAQVGLTPLARLLGEPGFGPVSAALLGLGEGALFGAGLAFGLTRRP